MPSVQNDRLTSVPTSLNHHIRDKNITTKTAAERNISALASHPSLFQQHCNRLFLSFPLKVLLKHGNHFCHVLYGQLKNLKDPDLGALKVIWKQLCVTEAIMHRIIILLAFTEKVKQHRSAIKFQGCSHPCLIVEYCNREFIERLDF